MNDKQLYDLRENDLIENEIWYFPMDDTVEDELTVRPFHGDFSDNDYQIIVRADFIDSEKMQRVGYVYWSKPEDVQDLKPVMFADDCAITFWNGMLEPSWDDYDQKCKHIKNCFPIKYQSVHVNNLGAVSGQLAGLYYIDKNGDVQKR